MKAGIVSYGAYVPIYRLSREEIVRVWGSGYRKGEKAVANCDEDSLTMGVAAALDCLKGCDRGPVDGLYFASTSAPYREKQSASIIAAALDLLMGEPGLADRLGRQGGEYFEENYSWPRIVEKYERLLAMATAGGARG